MVKVIDHRQERGTQFSEISRGQVFWSPTYLCFMIKIEECGCDECTGLVNAVSLTEGSIYGLEPTEIVEPCKAANLEII